MVPEKRTEILERADVYAHNRLVCGVHTASDLEASRRIAEKLGFVHVGIERAANPLPITSRRHKQRRR